MTPGSSARSAYRAPRVSRTLVLEIGRGGFVRAACVVLGIALVAGAAWSSMDGATADVFHVIHGPRTDSDVLDSDSDTDSTIQERFPLTLGLLTMAWLGGGDQTHVNWGPRRWETALLLSLAAVAFLATRRTPRRGTLTLDERGDRVVLEGVRVGVSETTMRRLADLVRADVHERGLVVHLVFADGERVDVEVPPAGGGAAGLARAVNDFIAPRA